MADTVPIPQGATIEPIQQAQAAPQSVPIPQGATLEALPGAQPKERGIMDSVKDFTSEWWKQVNPVEGFKQLRDMAASPLKSGKAMLENQGAVEAKAEEAFKRGDYTEGVRHVLNYLLPVIGPTTDKAGDLMQSGEYAKGLGMTAGAATNVAVPELAKAKIPLPARAADKAAEMYQSALKPSTAMPMSKVNSVVQTGLDNKIPVTPGGVEKIGGLINDLNDKIAATVKSDPTKTVNKFKVTSRLGDTAKEFATQVNPEADLKAVGDSGNEFLRNQPNEIPAVDAQKMKQGTYRQLGKKSFGELQAASVESQKALARGIKEELAQQFPELSQLNAADSKLLDLQPVLQKAVQRIGNHQLMGIGTPMAAAGAEAVTGNLKVAAAVGAIKLVIDNPMVKSHLAIALSRASKGGIPMPAAYARIAAYSNLLAQHGAAANSEPPADQTTGK